MTKNDSERVLQLSKARKILTVFVLFAMTLMALCGFFLSVRVQDIAKSFISKKAQDIAKHF